MNNNNSDDGPRVITDARGRSVEVPAEINSIVCVKACALRMVSYFDAIDKVIAVESYEKGTGQGGLYSDKLTYRVAFPWLKDLPDIGGADNPEKIIEANPDIVFCTTIAVSELDAFQEKLGIPVFAINADLEFGDEAFFDQITMMGKVLKEEKRAAELNKGIKNIIKDCSGRLPTIIKTAYATGMQGGSGSGLLKTSGDYLPFDDTNVKNVMPSSAAGVGKQPYQTDLESLIKANPQYVFVDMNASAVKADYKSFVQDGTGIENLTAFKNKDVYTNLIYKIYGTNWDNQLCNLYFIGKTVYPELYKDVDPQKKAEEIWKLFFQVDLSYDKVVNAQGFGFGTLDLDN
jgi:iron complex transport system substrate-binding protein